MVLRLRNMITVCQRERGYRGGGVVVVKQYSLSQGTVLTDQTTDSLSKDQLSRIEQVFYTRS